MTEIYIIMWRGRDSESEIWDDYPCFNCGFFTEKDKAEQFVIDLNNQEPAEYDEDAQETSGYYVALLRKNERETKGE